MNVMAEILLLGPQGDKCAWTSLFKMADGDKSAQQEFEWIAFARLHVSPPVSVNA